MLAVLLANRNRVVGRRELARQAGLAELNQRRCDSVLVGVRRQLGPDSIITVRSTRCPQRKRCSPATRRDRRH